ncbi:hypothetical protein ABBQ32_005274 [Trebouxia sp. C0010 RCD-2024]
MGRLFLEPLDGRVYSCACCGAHLARVDDLVSKSFHSRSGRAYLFSAVVNLMSAEKEARLMTTGLHTVCDLYCNGCMQVVGWSYIWAEEPSQKYKEGKSIIERTKVVFSKHDDESPDHCPISPMISFVGMTLDSEMEEDGC